MSRKPDNWEERVQALQSSVSEKLEDGGEQAMEAVHSKIAKLEDKLQAAQSTVHEKLELQSKLAKLEDKFQAAQSTVHEKLERVQAAQSTVHEKLKGRVEAVAQQVKDLVPLRARLLVHVMGHPGKGAIWVLGIAAGVAIVRAMRFQAKRAREDREAGQLLQHTGSMWESSQAVIEATERHPFLLAMLDGSLPVHKFRYYIEQDAMYLRHFAAALRLAARTAPTWSDAAALRTFASGAESAELALHEGFFQQWQQQQQQGQHGQQGEGKKEGGGAPSASSSGGCSGAGGGTPMAPMTSHYTSYLLSVCATGSHGEALSALLPCFVVYHHVGVKMLARRRAIDGDGDGDDKRKDGDGEEAPSESSSSSSSPASPPEKKRPAVFDQWIDMYGGEAFAEAVKSYRLMTERVAMQAPPDIRQKMHGHFNRACVLEYMFWTAALDLEAWPLHGKSTIFES